MRALQLSGKRQLDIVDKAPPPPPAANEVQIAVKRVALNHIDVWGWRGMAFAKRELPMTVGAEAAGEIVAVGEAVTDRRVGQGVAIYGAELCHECPACLEGRENLCEGVLGVHGFHLDGFAQELKNFRASLTVPMPEGLDYTAASLSPITFGTSEHMLFDNAQLKSGEWVLVHAGGSGIGTSAIQLAKDAGATVITTVGSDAKADKAIAIGADHVINYREDRFESKVRRLTGKKGVDVVFEHVGAETWNASLLSMKKGGRLVTCGSTSGVSTEMNLMQLFQRQYRIFGSFGCRLDNLATSMEKMASGRVKPIVDAEIEMEEIDGALQRMENRDVFGKIVVKIAA